MVDWSGGTYPGRGHNLRQGHVSLQPKLMIAATSKIIHKVENKILGWVYFDDLFENNDFTKKKNYFLNFIKNKMAAL